MSKHTFDTAAIYGISEEIFDIIVGNPIGILKQIKQSHLYSSMIDEISECQGLNGDIEDFPTLDQFEAYNIEEMSNFYELQDIQFYPITIKIKLFPNKSIYY